MNKIRTSVLCLVMVASAAKAADHYQAPGNCNPLVPGYFADPTVKRFGETFYMYATTDGTNTGRAPASVWTSKDFVNWTHHALNWPTTHFVWAPEVIYNESDGRYYYYYSQPCMIFGGSAKTPLGPFEPLTDNGLVVENYLIEDIMTLDGQILKDDDGGMYMFWGTWGVFENHGVGIGKLNPDMKSFSELRAVRNAEAVEFFEAPEPVKHEGAYYLTYSSGSCHDHTYRVQYAVSTEGVYGPYTFPGNNPILATSADGTVHGPGHHCVLLVDGTYYMVYHRHDLPNSAGGMFRQVAADVMKFGPDHTIEKVKPTHAGIGYLGRNANPFENLAHGAKVTASSYNRTEFRPESAVDDNNATQWRAGSNALPAWLEMDLGSVRSIARIHTQFEYAHWYYRYLIEFSVDGENWHVFSDKRNNTHSGSPMVDYGRAEARYLRITITGVERQGMCPAIWNFKAFSGAKEDPPQQLVHLEAEDLQGGEMARWTNHRGMMGGCFQARGEVSVGRLAGRQALTFDRAGLMESSFQAPDSENAYTVMGWVYPRTREGSVLVAGQLSVPAGLFDVGVWQCFAVTVEDGESICYIDDTKKTVGRYGGASVFAGSMLRLGEGWAGGLAQIRIFNRKLHPVEMGYYRQKKPQTPQGPAEPTHGLVVHLDAMDGALGSLIDEWKNRAPFGGAFVSSGHTRIGVMGGRQAILFDGRSHLRSAFNAPRSLCGNGAYTVAVWAFNPDIGEEEALVGWSRRGGPDSTAATLGFGSHGRWGAMAHWGYSDMAYGDRLPPAGRWTHIAAVFDGTYVTLYVDGEPISEMRTTLFLHPDEPVVIGAGPGNHAPFSGAISSVRLYDEALDPGVIRALAAEEQPMEIGVNMEAWRLPYGRVEEIPNRESLGGSFIAAGAGAQVKDVAGRIAVALDEGSSLTLHLPAQADPLAGGRCTVIAVVHTLSHDAWRMIARTVNGEEHRHFVDGRLVSSMEVPVDLSLAKPIMFSRSDGVTAVASLIIMDRALTVEELHAWHAATVMDGPEPDPMTFAASPVAITTESVLMTAAEPKKPAGLVEYHFQEVSERPGGKDSGWIMENTYLNTGLRPNMEYAYTVRMRDAYGNVTRPSEPVLVVTDPALFEMTADRFDTDRDFLVEGTEGTIWDGFIGSGQGESVAVLAVRDGVLRIASTNTDWAFGTPKGPFLYRKCEGDFVVQVELTDSLGLRQRSGYGNNDTGLMIRVADSDGPDREEKHFSIGFFPGWGCGNLWTNRRGSSRPQGHNRKGLDADRHLQVQKSGNLLFVRTSPDGKTWTDMKDSPFVRDDMQSSVLQVGIYHATYGNIEGYGEFDNFQIIRRKRQGP